MSMGLEPTAPEEIDLALLTRLGTMTDRASQRALFEQNPQLLTREVVISIRDHVLRQVRIEPHSAIALSAAALAIAEELGDQETLAQAFRIKANALYFNGHYREAVDYHRRTASLFRAIGNANELARTLSSSIQPRILLGEYDDALAAAQEARSVFEAQGNRWRLARLEINTGNIYHRQDRFEQALAFYERAEEVLREFDDAEGTAAALSNIATCLIMRDEFNRALEVHQRAREFCAAHGMTALARQADYNIAWLHFMRGSYGVAIEKLLTLRETCLREDDRLHYSLCQMDLAETYVNLNLSEDAQEAAKEAGRGFEQLGMTYERAKCQATEALAMAQAGRIGQALDLFEDARSRFILEGNQAWPRLIDLYRAQSLCLAGRYYEAAAMCSAALADRSPAVSQAGLVMWHLVDATVRLHTRQVEQGLASCREALALLEHFERPQLLLNAHVLAGELLLAAGRRSEAREELRIAQEQIEILRGSVDHPEMKIAFFADKRRVYEYVVELCLEEGAGGDGIGEAFRSIELAKSRTVAETMWEPLRAETPEPVGGGSLVRRTRQLREEINWFYQRIEQEQLRAAEYSPERVSALQAKARERESQFARVLRELRGRSSSVSRLGAPRPVAVERLRADLGDRTAVLSYFTANERILACVIRNDALEIVPVTVESRIRKLLSRLRFQLSKTETLPERVWAREAEPFKAVHAHLAALYDELVRPIAARIDRERVVIVPHGVLHYLPFHAFRDGERHLIDRCEVSYAPSATVYWLCQQRKVSPDRTTDLVMGVPDPRAPFILDEVQTVTASLTNPALFIGELATAGTLREVGSKARNIHLATHGVFRNDNPMFSSIKLGDGYLNVYDLDSLRLECDLIALSGCATGLSGLGHGDEILGLTRGLLTAGARSLLLTQWNVNDASTADFMASFYDRLAAGDEKPAALRKAMLESRERYPHPYHWAPFQLVGGV